MSGADLFDRLSNAGAVVTPAASAASTVLVGHAPEWLVEPTSLHQLGAVVRILDDSGIPWRVDSRGRNWGYDDARLRTPGVIVRLARLDRLSLDVELGLATVQPGVTFAKLKEALTEAGARFYLPPPGSGPHTSVLGNALDRGLLSGLGERERHCRDFLVMERDGSLHRPGWTGAEDARVRGALPYPPGPHGQGALFQTAGYGPVVVELTHVLQVATAQAMRLVVLSGPVLTEELVRCWRELLLEGLVSGSLLAPQARRRAQGTAIAHDGLVLDLSVTAGSVATLRAKAADVQRVVRQHGQRLALRVSEHPDDLRILGGDGERPEEVAQLASGLEWHTAALPFAPSMIVAFAKAVQAEATLADTPWSLRPLDDRAVVWLSPFVYRKDDPADIERLRRRSAAFDRIRGEFHLPTYRSGGARGGR
ncbi:FAD-binding protein [Micromonospora okii]|uniref:FAD-binding protein n=1 Tax=Micromonospora okii TaxID=1182970 RepID=UPI001E40596D|nr:FAD-binding protein [Micromonospora okii]